MTTYKGETLDPVLVEDAALEGLLQRLINITEELKSLYEERDAILQGFPKNKPLVAEVTKDGLTEYRTFIVGTPTGHYVQYKELDFVMDAKTTKKDMQTLFADQENV